jgi:Skp family chaperone for outer membrane proteins
MAKRLQSDYEAIAKRSRSNSQRRQRDCKAITKRLQSDRVAIRSDGKAIAKRLQSDSKAKFSQRFHSDIKTIMHRCREAIS